MKAVIIGMIACILIGCESEPASEPMSETTDSAISGAQFDEYAAQYQEKVRKRFSNAIVGALASDWNVSEDNVKCLLKDVPMERLELAKTDPEVTAVFETCGVDPAVVDQ